MYPDIATLCNSKRRVVSKGTCPFYRDVWQVQKVPRWGCETNVCLPTIRQTRWILRVTSSFFGTECVFPVFMVYILFSHMNVSTNCPAREVLDTLFLFEVLARIATAPLKRLQGTIGTPRDQRSREQYLPVFFMVQMTFAVFVHEQHWSHLLASWLGQHVATLSWIWVRFQVKSGNFQINIRKLDENHLSSPSSRLYVFWSVELGWFAQHLRMALSYRGWIRISEPKQWSLVRNTTVDGWW